MARKFTGDTLIIASHNPGKVREIAALLDGRVRDCVSAAALDLADPEETGDTFRANAELKARYVAAATDGPALADDSGLVVPALDGEPGIHSARWAERPDGTRDFADAMARLEERLAERGADRGAYFACVLALCWPDGHCETVDGHVHGSLVWPPRGGQGFGYDPVFLPVGGAKTFGEMAPADKHRISHRAAALAQLRARCFDP